MSQLINMLAGSLFIFSGLAFLAGVYVLKEGKGAIHEIEAFIIIVISAVLLVGAATTFSINWLAKIKDEKK